MTRRKPFEPRPYRDPAERYMQRRMTRKLSPLLVQLIDDEIWFVVECPECNQEISRFRSPGIVKAIDHACPR